MQLVDRIAALVLVWSSVLSAEELVCENEALRLVVHSRSAAWRVVDKRARHTWRPASPAMMPTFALPRCPGPITIDGHLADWQWLDRAGTPVTHVTAGARTGDDDCSARFRAAWDGSCVYFAVEVKDDTFVEPPSAHKFWLGDSVELWVGGDQFGVGTVGGKPFVVCYNRPAAAKGAKAAVLRRGDDWICEVALAVGSLTPTAARKQPTPMAVGVNDADVPGQREAQKYYPSTWVQWDTSTYVLACFVAHASQRAEAAKPAAPVRCTAARRAADKRSIVLDMPGLLGRNRPARATFTLAPGRPEVLVEIDAAPDAGMSTCAFPEPLPATTADAAWVVPSQEGLLYRVRGDRYPVRGFRSMMSMPWIGAADLKTGMGYMIIAETPDDMHFDKHVVRIAGEKLPVGSPLWLAQKGKFGYARRARYVFFDKGGYVAMCKRYRQHARSAGMVRTLAEKARDVPNVRKLAGAVDVWYSGRGAVVETARLLKSLGVDRCLMHISSVGYRPAKSTVAALHDLGYLVGHYDIYTDLHESGHPWDKWERYAQYRFPEPVIRKSDGSLQRGWYTVYDQGKPYRSYVVCPIRGLEAMRQRVPSDHEATGHSVWFVDCATSCGLYECYHSDHPATRTQDREAKLDQFRFLHDRGLVCGSEGGRDWALRYASYFEGIMGTATWAAAPKNMGRVTGPLDVTEKYMEFDHGPSRRVPLWELVHHDASLVTWWWGDGQLRVSENWWLKDLWQILYGTMPLWMMRREGEQLFIENTEAFRASYRRISPVTRAVFGVEMLSHEFLSEDCAVQRTHWANGLTVTVNFGEAPGAIGDMPAMPGRSYRLDGDAARFPKLPLGKPVVMPYDWKPKVSKGMLNADFAAGTFGWSSTEGISLSVVQAAHDGKNAAQFTGKNERDWTLGRSAATFALQPGKRYRFGGWVKLTALEPNDQPPWLALTITGAKGWITNIHTPRCDPKRLGTWQLLERSFVCPEGGEVGHFNIEKHSRARVTITLLLSEPFFEAE